eukprot:2339591-Rhodomonas_salina.2
MRNGYPGYPSTRGTIMNRATDAADPLGPFCAHSTFYRYVHTRVPASPFHAKDRTYVPVHATEQYGLAVD